MIKVSFKVNGRNVPVNRVGDELMKGVTQKATDLAVRHVSKIRCPVHDKTAKLHPVSPNSAQFRIEGCCDDHIQEVHRQLNSSH